MKHTFIPSGVCSRRIDFEIEDGAVKNIEFTGGCDGNLKAISILAEGMQVDEVIEKLAGNTCGHRDTSCADQFTMALRQALAE
ncbi:MAG: TIGR03905 family TSCPD domain-containing protein [Firmicutes bacterium]|nr:TIGR03905 family TSCPD domain-containing protein [Bacillota bacterium]